MGKSKLPAVKAKHYVPKTKQRNRFLWIFNQQDNKYVQVYKLKTFTVPQHPDYIFSIHRSLKRAGFTVSEHTTGSSVCQSQTGIMSAYYTAKEILAEVSSEAFNAAVARARKTVNKSMKESMKCLKQ